MGSSRKIFSGVVWTTLLNIINAIYGFIAVPILINYFGKAEYGLIGLAMSINVYMRLMDMGFNSTNVRFFSTWLTEQKNEKVKKAFQTSLFFYGGIGILNGLILLLVACFSDRIFNVSPSQDIILKHLLFILSFSAFCNWFSSCFDQLIKATENVAWILRRQLIPKLLQILVLFLTVSIGLSIECYYLLTCFAALSIVPLSLNKIKIEVPYISFKPKLDKKVFWEMLPYSMNIFSFSIFQFSFYNLRPVFLGMQGSIESVADFRILNGIVGIVHMLGGAFIGVLLPSTAKVLARKDKDAYYRVAYDGTKYISILLCFCTFGMMSLGKEALSLYVGTDYLYLVPWLNLWLVCGLGGHNQAISSLILAGTDVRAISYSSAISSVVGLAVSWFLIPFFQIGGVIIGFAVYGLIQIFFYYLYYWPKKMNIDPSKVLSYSFGPYLLLGIVLYIICSNLPHLGNAWGDFLFIGSVFFLLYVSVIVLTLNQTDKEYLYKTFRKNQG